MLLKLLFICPIKFLTQTPLIMATIKVIKSSSVKSIKAQFTKEFACSIRFYNGKKITKNSPGLGYVLGDEGSGAYLGKKVLQYFLYNTFDEELMNMFDKKYQLGTAWAERVVRIPKK